MTREEAIEFGNMWLQINEDCKDSSTYAFFQMAIKALEQDTVPFDFELYQAGLMDMPKGMIEVLDRIRAEIDVQVKTYYIVGCYADNMIAYGLKLALEIIDNHVNVLRGESDESSD